MQRLDISRVGDRLSVVSTGRNLQKLVSGQSLKSNRPLDVKQTLTRTLSLLRRAASSKGVCDGR